MKNDSPITTTKNSEEKNNNSKETFPHSLFFRSLSNQSNPEFNSNSPRNDIKFSDQDDQLKNFLPHDLITSLEINENDFSDEKKNNNNFLRNTISQFPKSKKNNLKEDECISNENTMTNSDSRFSFLRNSNKTENNIQGYQNINQLILDSPISPFLNIKRNCNSMTTSNNILMPSSFFSPVPNIILPPNINNNNLINYKLNNQNTTENINQYFKDNKIINNDDNINRRSSFTFNTEYFSNLNDNNNNNNLCPPSFLHYSAGFNKNSINNNFNINDNINEELTKSKKNKKKKKHKDEDDEYITEMFGRRGWICEECNNFNYETRNKCNRCKIPKKPLKIKTFIDNNGEKKLIDNVININHKDDWSCPNCNNINYAFRLVCNRCQMSKEELTQAGLFEKVD